MNVDSGEYDLSDLDDDVGVKRKIPVGSAEHRSRYEYRRIFLEVEDAVFGQPSLNSIDWLPRLPESLLIERYKTQDKEVITTKILDQTRDVLKGLYGDQRSRRHVEGLYFEGAMRFHAEYPVLQPLNTVFRGMGLDVEPEALDLCDPDVIDDELLIKILQNHSEVFLKKKEKFMSGLSERREVFLQRLQTFTKEKGIAVIPEDLQRKADELKFSFVDPLVISLEEVVGTYNPEEHHVRIAGNLKKGQVDHVVTHEVLHGVSGQTILSSKGLFEDEGEISYQRVGLRINAKGNHFKWLNEGVTESLAMELVGDNLDIYSSERELLNLLLTSGSTEISDILVHNAYFEDFDSSKSPGERIPAWKAFYQAVNQAYAPGFLTMLDAYIQGNGVKAGIDQIGKDWHTVMEVETRSKRKSRLKKDASISPEERQVTALAE